MTEQTLKFETEVGKILHIVATALYRDRQIFLRELISNASDACDRLRYLAITNPELTADDPEFNVTISVDKEAGTLTIADNGIGMNRDAMIADLGTIARSGSSAFLESLSGDNGKDVGLIGQFGVGFYSCFMVSDNVEVVSLRAGEDQAWRWASNGEGEFTIGEVEKEGRGTRITLHLKEDASEFLEPIRLRTIVGTYSDHIQLPIKMATTEDGEAETVNQASALWTRPRADITPEQYTEFFRHVAHAFDEPWHTIHWRAEGRIEYTGLLFIPQTPPMDLFAPERKHGIKLYVKRVFITDDCEGLAPGWMRFVRGLIDSEDLPLNVSRDLLQNNPLLTQIRKALVNRVLGELDTRAEKSPEEYATFWGSFGSVFKEGLYEDYEHRDRLLKLVRFASTTADGEPGTADALVSLDDYVGRMKEGQNAIYYISGEELAAVKKSPQLEGFRAKGIEVLLMTDPVDEFWLPAIGEFEGKPFRSATRAGADLGAIKGDGKDSSDSDDDKEGAKDHPGLDSLIVMIKLELGDEIKDVRASERLTDSPVCLVSDEGDIDIRLEQLLRQHNKLEEKVSRVLEINPTHPLITALTGIIGDDGAGTKVTEAAWLLLDQARILEGETLPDPNAFVRRLATLMAEGIKG
jgi:molecular chaperone HtpG